MRLYHTPACKHQRLWMVRSKRGWNTYFVTKPGQRKYLGRLRKIESISTRVTSYDMYYMTGQWKQVYP